MSHELDVDALIKNYWQKIGKPYTKKSIDRKIYILVHTLIMEKSSKEKKY